MMLVARARALGLSTVAATVLATCAVAAWAAESYWHDYAARSAATIVSYLAIVTPETRRGEDYDLPALLIQARALDALAAFGDRVEIYHGAAPLVHATGALLSRSSLDALRSGATDRWEGGAALAPLLTPDGRHLAGAVAVRPDGSGKPPRPLTLIAALVALFAGATALARGLRSLGGYAFVALVLGISAGNDVRGAARRATDRWLVETKRLLEEAAVRHPGIRASAASLSGVPRGAELVPADSGDVAPARIRVGAAPRAVTRVRLGPGRWAELRTFPAEDPAGFWLVITVVLAGLGPASVAFLRYRARSLRERG